MDRIEQLSRQIALAFEIIDRVDNQSIASRVVIEALIATHPAPAKLLEELRQQRETSFSVALAYPLDDSRIEAIHREIDRVIDALAAQLPAGGTPRE